MMTSLLAMVASVAAVQATPDWSSSCSGLDDFWPDACDVRFTNAYERGLCRAAQAKTIEGSHVRLRGVRTVATYNAKRERFEVEVPSLFVRQVRLKACGETPCVSRIVVGRYFTWPSKESQLTAKLDEIQRGASGLERAFTRFTVPLMDVPNPKRFEADLEVDVLLKVVRTSSAAVPGKLVAHAIYGVPAGIVARVRGGGWSKELRRTPKKKTACVRPRALGNGSVAVAVAGSTPGTGRPAPTGDRPGPSVAPPDVTPPEPTKPEPAKGGRSLTKEQVGATIDHYAGALQVCYRKELGQAPDLKGTLTFQFTIRPDGGTSGVKETARTMNSDNVAGCVGGVLQQMRFPRFSGGPVTIVYPFEFGGE